VCVCVCVCTVGRAAARPTVRTHTHQWFKITLPNTTKHTKNICEPLRIISVKYSSILPDDGSRTIRNNVGVIFNSVSFKILWNVDFNL